MTDHIMPTYARQPISFERGEGLWLFDTNGKRYLDLLSGIAVVALGHSHPAISAAIEKQADKLMQVSNGYEIPEQTELANTLCRLSGMDNAFFCNSGAEAVECALKLVRLWGRHKGLETPTVICAEKAFHGRTFGAIAAGGNPKVRAGFEPHLEKFVHVPYNDVAAIEQALMSNKDIVAVMLEPIQGEGGVQVPADDYLNKVRDCCDKHQVLMVLDEVQTGIGRTGEHFAFQHNGITPDVMCLAKGMGNGFPIGACLAAGEAADVLKIGNHGSTFGGNPLACKVSQTLFNVFEKEDLLEKVRDNSAYFMDQLRSVLGKHDCVKDIRGKGFMIGVELDKDATSLRAKGQDKGLIFNVTAQKVIRMVPPLILDKPAIDQAVAILDELIADFCD